MAFPTTALLDDFNRANENPLSIAGSLGAPIVSGVHQTFKLVSNAIQDDSLADGGGSAQVFWDAANFGPGVVEVYVTFPAIWGNNSSDFWFWLHGNAEASAGRDGYVAYASYLTGVWRYKMNRADNDVETEIRAFENGPTLAAGDKLGVEASATGVFTWYYKASAGSWGAAAGLSTTTSTTYTSGHIGLSKGFNDTTSTIDDFGGGNQVVAGDPEGLLFGGGKLVGGGLLQRGVLVG